MQMQIERDRDAKNTDTVHRQSTLQKIVNVSKKHSCTKNNNRYLCSHQKSDHFRYHSFEISSTTVHKSRKTNSIVSETKTFEIVNRKRKCAT